MSNAVFPPSVDSVARSLQLIPGQHPDWQWLTWDALNSAAHAELRRRAVRAMEAITAAGMEPGAPWKPPPRDKVAAALAAAHPDRRGMPADLGRAATARFAEEAESAIRAIATAMRSQDSDEENAE